MFNLGKNDFMYVSKQVGWVKSFAIFSYVYHMTEVVQGLEDYLGCW